MPSPWIVIVVAASLVATIVVVVRIVRAHAEDVRTLPKTVWYLIAFVPILGAIGWAWLGRPHYVPRASVSPKTGSAGGSPQKMTADRQMIVDRLTSDVRTREARTSGLTAGSPGSPGSLTARTARSAASAVERSAASPSTSSYSDEQPIGPDPRGLKPGVGRRSSGLTG
jgi:hypothetical protein